MVRNVLIVLVAAACVAFYAPGAGAVAPQGGATLTGTIKSSPFNMTVTINISPSGGISSLTYLCGTGRPPTSVYHLSVDSAGHFSAQDAGSWKLLGHFVTPTTAFVSLNSIACGASKGSTTLHLKTGATGPAAATTSGVTPQAGATLTGTINSSPFPMTVTINVGQTGAISSLTYLCGTGRPPTSIYKLSVDSTGHFSYQDKDESWKLAGHFITPDSAFVSLNSIACGGGKGSTTLHLKS